MSSPAPADPFDTVTLASLAQLAESAADGCAWQMRQGAEGRVDAIVAALADAERMRAMEPLLSPRDPHLRADFATLTLADAAAACGADECAYYDRVHADGFRTMLILVATSPDKIAIVQRLLHEPRNPDLPLSKHGP